MTGVTRAPLAESVPMRRVRLKDATAPLRIVYGDRFTCEVGPDSPAVEVTQEEWEQILKPTGYFVEEEA
jgi:hypothetical protein